MSVEEGVITRRSSGTVTFDAGPAWVRAAAFAKAARAWVLREWVTQSAIHGPPVEAPAGRDAPRAPNRRARRAAKARARGRAGHGALGTIEAVEHGVLHVRMPDGALERIEVHDPDGWFVVGGTVTIGGMKARAR